MSRPGEVESGVLSSSVSGHPVVLLRGADGILRQAASSVPLPGIDLDGQRLEDHVEPDDHERLAAAREQAVRGEVQAACRVRLVGARPTRWVEVRWLPGVVPDHVLVLLHDVGTERRLAAEAALLRRVTELSNAGTDIADASARAVHDLRVTLGLQAGHVLVVHDHRLEAAGVWDVEPGLDQLPAAVAAARGAAAGDEAAAAVEHRLPVSSADGGGGLPDVLAGAGVEAVLAVPVVAEDVVVRVLELFAAHPVELDDDRRRLLAEVGRQLGSVAVRQGYLDQLEESHTELARSNAELERFAYVASHDLQEPLRKIVGFAELLQQHQGPWGEEQDEHLGFVVQSAMRMQRLIKDLLAFSRAGRRELRHEPVDLDDVLADVLADLQLQVEDQDATVVVEGPLPSVVGDDGQLREALQNVVSNALRYRADDRAPRLVITGAVEGEVARVTVVDNGIGIAPEHRESVFEVFRRLHPAHRYGGTGLGLALVQRIIERHGGTVELHDTPTGEGIAVHLLLPVERPHHD